MKQNKTEQADRQRQPEVGDNMRDLNIQVAAAEAEMLRERYPTQPTAARTVAQVKYEFSDCGCYVDGSHGIYAIDAIVEFAERHGFTIEPCDDQHYETCFESRFAGCEFAGEIEDEASDYMNANYPVDGAGWGRSEQGDWGLWESEG